MNASIEKYLKAYNIVQFVLWTMAIFILQFHFLYSFYLICIAQSLSIAEVYHAHKKWNQSSPFLCFVQIAARLFILYFTATLLLYSVFKPILYFYSVTYVMLLFWCIAEIMRYAYYITMLFKIDNKPVKWIRYSAFIICYPIGLACEFFIMFTVFKTYDISLKILMMVVAISYIFLFPKLYMHLLNQRKLKLISK